MKNFWAVIILIVLLLGLGLYFSSHSENVPPVEEAPATSTGSIIASTTKMHTEDKENKFIADVELPSISGHINAEAYNELAQIYVDRATEEFARNAVEANFNIPDIFKNEKHTFIAQAKTDIIRDRYVATLFVREYGIVGAAHPFEFMEALNYDLEAKKVIELSDIFTNVDQALSYISSRAAEQVKANLATFDGADSFIAAGVEAEEANFRTYVMSNQGITFHFAEYQVAPYAAGPQKAMVTWYEIRPLLTPEYKALAD